MLVITIITKDGVVTPITDEQLETQPTAQSEPEPEVKPDDPIHDQPVSKQKTKRWLIPMLATVCLVVGLMTGYLLAGILAPDHTLLQDIPYEVDIDPDDFIDGVDHPYFPLIPGRKLTYTDGEETIVVVTTNETKVVMGVQCVVVRDTVSKNGKVIEDTYDWFAQDKYGNVWYMGEDSTEYDDGGNPSTAGSWEAGVDGALPGIYMLANPIPGLAYRQEYYKGEAEDMGAVISLNETAEVPYGTYTGCLMTKDWNVLEPGIEEHKYYAEGIGVVLEKDVKGGSGRVELVAIEGP